MKLLPLVVIFTLGLVGCGGDGTETKSAKSANEAKLATKAGLVHCLEKAGVAFDPSGSVPDDPGRKKWPRGWNPPAGGGPAEVEYAGAASFDEGGLADVWIVKSVSRAEDLVAAFAPDMIDPSDPTIKYANDWFWDQNRNLLLAISDNPTPDVDDRSSGKFDRCLEIS